MLCHVLVCSIDAPAESGAVIVLWSIVWDRYACIQSYIIKISEYHFLQICPSMTQDKTIVSTKQKKQKRLDTKRVNDTPLHDRTKVDTTDVLLKRVHRNCRAGLSKHDIAGAQTSLE